MSHRKLDASLKKLTLFYTLFVLIVYHAYVIFTHMALLQFTSIRFNFLSLLFYLFIFFPEVDSSWKGFSALAGLPTLKAAIPWAYPSFSSCQFPVFFPFPKAPFQFPAFVLPHVSPLPVYLLGELGPLSYMTLGMAACNTHINDDFITAVHYDTQCAD